MSKRTLLSTAFALLGVYCVFQVLPWYACAASLVCTMATETGKHSGFDLISLAMPLVFVLVYSLAAYVLVFHGDGLARRMVRQDEALDFGRATQWHDTVLRVGFAILGVLFLVRVVLALPYLVKGAGDTLGFMPYGQQVQTFFATPNLHLYVVRQILTVALAMYLLVGAPRFRRFVLQRMQRPVVDDAHNETKEAGKPSASNADTNAAENDESRIGERASEEES